MNASEVVIRASSWSGLFDCAYKWEGVHLLGITKPAGLRALLGSALHRSTAAFDEARMEGSPASVDDTAGLAVDLLRNPDFEVDASQDDLTVWEAERIALPLHVTYCRQWSPRFRFRAVEARIAPFRIDCGDTTVVLTGQLDRSRVVAGSDKDRIVDLKSGGAAVQKGAAVTKGHGAQVGAYGLLYEATTGREVDDTAEIIGLKTRGKPEVASGEIRGTRRLMVGDENAPGLIEIAAQMFRTGLFPPNPGSMLCSQKYCPRWNACPYHL